MEAMIPDVIEVRPLEGTKLWLRFEDGAEGVVDLAELQLPGILETLKDPDLFARAYVDPELGTVAWPGGADLDPLVLYARITGRSPVPGLEIAYQGQ